MNLTEYASHDGLGLAAVAGPAVGGPFEIPRPATPYLAEIARPAGSRRIAVTTKAWSGLRVDPAVAAAVAAIANLLEQMGHTVIEDTPAFDYGGLPQRPDRSLGRPHRRLYRRHRASRRPRPLRTQSAVDQLGDLRGRQGPAGRAAGSGGGALQHRHARVGMFVEDALIEF